MANTMVQISSLYSILFVSYSRFNKRLQFTFQIFTVQTDLSAAITL